MILIGSQAIKYWYPDFKREPKDMDFIVRENEKTPPKGKNIEFLLNPIFSNKWKYRDNCIMYPDDLATLKASHLCWDINWDKHMFDLQFLLKRGCVIDKDLFLELYGYWNEYHGKNKRSDLKMSKDEFFTNAINYNVCEHDEMHEMINSSPIYKKILQDGKDVELSEDKYNLLSHEDKMNLVREEVMVMAYERYKHLNYNVAYTRMLKKFIMNHAPIFTLFFIFENYIELHKAPYNYIELINNKIKNKQL